MASQDSQTLEIQRQPAVDLEQLSFSYPFPRRCPSSSNPFFLILRLLKAGLAHLPSANATIARVQATLLETALI